MNRSEGYLRNLQQRRLVVRSKKRGVHNGSRQSSKFGSSLEFSDYRVYQPGDDVRLIDWNVYGRTQKHYIKRFLDEQEISIAIYLDGTASMRHIAAKWHLAKKLAAALSYLVLKEEDRLFFSLIPTSNTHPLKRKGAIYSKKTFLDIISLDTEVKSGGFVKILEQSLAKKHQLSILITDGMEEIGYLETVFRKMKAFKQEIWMFQVLAAEEITPTYSGDVKLIDSEKDTAVNVSMNDTILRDYQRRMVEHTEQLELLCLRYGGTFLQLTEEKELHAFLLRDMVKKGLIQ
ncbi:DUF58 domain-containing protein [Cytobacillus horneckiae]|uniref:DUF58 domain-containing protein n=1 Tax=Cytobacillus horneckiae TaxID=549687 RepID=A0A2N0ZM48_9BACI|nr:DUF58 domain-containing protein [Cytobacillus horneckiae]MEC1156984.1 DUF58 domain-containing protein [Cytobacillus horneckiae]MED2939990.1 DUF58 domain-containing protein [Cytobacillus horneckiae]PKG30585.1 DUF58 domain-containing protein [Cytobacillus horneckiae]